VKIVIRAISVENGKRKGRKKSCKLCHNLTHESREYRGKNLGKLMGRNLIIYKAKL
jgi:cytochrome c2